MIAAAPGRLVDFIERGKVKLCEIKFLTLDEVGIRNVRAHARAHVQG